jgi:hypothetical protein
MTLQNQSAGYTKEQILALWEEKLNSLFPGGVPSDYVWSERADIIRVLGTIAQEDLNELLFPDGGGLDLTGAAESTEADCIELHFDGRIDIVKPERLMFHSFESMWDWAYFRLDSLPLEPTGIYEPSDQIHEEVLEVAPGEYVDSAVLYAGANEAAKSDDSLPALDTVRRVIRHFRGSFAIFPKRARYMTVLGAYDGRHDKSDDAQFNQYVQNAVQKMREREERKRLGKK